MNKENILFNLREAKEELDRTIDKLGNKTDYDYEEYLVAMTHLYHHINTAWNARDVDEKRAKACSEEDFQKWRRFPNPNELAF